MKLVSELKESGNKSIIVVLAGNGRTEQRVLKSLAEKYDGSRKLLFFPRTPFHFRPGSGLKALKAVKIYSSRYKITRALFIVDKEHLGKEKSNKKISLTLKSFGISVRKIESFQKFGHEAMLIRCSVGRRGVLIYAAILGEKKSIEENIAKLIELELGRKIDPKKNVIRRVLREHKIDIGSLVMKARSSNLMSAFPSLSLVLTKIEKNGSKAFSFNKINLGATSLTLFKVFKFGQLLVYFLMVSEIAMTSVPFVPIHFPMCFRLIFQ